MGKGKLTDVDVRIMVVQPTKEGIEEIAHDRLKVPYLVKEKAKSKESKSKTAAKQAKPRAKTVRKTTKEKTGRTEE